jgi:hypothetical protein
MSCDDVQSSPSEEKNLLEQIHLPAWVSYSSERAFLFVIVDVSELFLFGNIELDSTVFPVESWVSNALLKYL